MRALVWRPLLLLLSLCFWPSKFNELVENQDPAATKLRNRRKELLRMIPLVALLTVSGNFGLGNLLQNFGYEFAWWLSWIGVVIAIVAGLGIGYGFGASLQLGLLFAIFGGIAAGAAFGCGLSESEAMDGGFRFGITFGIAIGTAGGISFGIALGGGGEIDDPGLGSFIFGIFLLPWSFAFFVAIPLGIAAGTIFNDGAAGILGGVSGGVAFSLTAGFSMAITILRIPSYLFESIWAEVCHVMSKSGFGSCRWWRFHPAYWHESTMLLLPRTEEMLTLACREDRDYGVSQIAFVSAKRPFQRQAARAALGGLAFDDLEAKSARSLAAVSEKLNWIEDAPDHIPEGLREVLPVFRRISRFAGQAVSIGSAFRKREVWMRAANELGSLQKHLISSDTRLAPRLLQRANKWSEMIDAEIELIAEQARRQRLIRQVFRFGSPVRDDEAYVFAGRTDIVREMETLFLADAHPPAILLHGSRRMGKSSILLQLPRMLGPDFAPCTLDCQNAAHRQSAAGFFQGLSRELSGGLKRRGVRQPKIERRALDERDPFEVFDDWLHETEEKMPEGMRALLCLDEYEALDQALRDGKSWVGDLLDTLRHIQQHRPKFALLFTGMRTFQGLGPEWTKRFVGSRRTRVSFLPAEDLRKILVSPVEDFELSYEPESAVDRILELSAGQPYLTQAIAKELVDLLNSEKRRVAKLEDIERAKEIALESTEAFLHNVWDDAGEEGRQLLQRILGGSSGICEKFRRSELEERESEFFANSATQLDERTPGFKHLREMDVLTEEGEIAVPLVELWLRRNVL